MRSKLRLVTQESASIRKARIAKLRTLKKESVSKGALFYNGKVYRTRYFRRQLRRQIKLRRICRINRQSSKTRRYLRKCLRRGGKVSIRSKRFGTRKVKCTERRIKAWRLRVRANSIRVRIIRRQSALLKSLRRRHRLSKRIRECAKSKLATIRGKKVACTKNRLYRWRKSIRRASIRISRRSIKVYKQRLSARKVSVRRIRRFVKRCSKKPTKKITIRGRRCSCKRAKTILKKQKKSIKKLRSSIKVTKKYLRIQKKLRKMNSKRSAIIASFKSTEYKFQKVMFNVGTKKIEKKRLHLYRAQEEVRAIRLRHLTKAIRRYKKRISALKPARMACKTSETDKVKVESRSFRCVAVKRATRRLRINLKIARLLRYQTARAVRASRKRHVSLFMGMPKIQTKMIIVNYVYRVRITRIRRRILKFTQRLEILQAANPQDSKAIDQVSRRLSALKLRLSNLESERNAINSISFKKCSCVSTCVKNFNKIMNVIYRQISEKQKTGRLSSEDID